MKIMPFIDDLLRQIQENGRRPDKILINWKDWTSLADELCVPPADIVHTCYYSGGGYTNIPIVLNDNVSNIVIMTRPHNMPSLKEREVQ